MKEVSLEIAYSGDEEKVIELDDGRRLRIGLYHDDDPLHPRDEYDNFGTMVCWHSRYNLGDEQPGGSPQEWRESLAMSLDPSLEDRLWHWHSGNGWTSLINERDRRRRDLLVIASSLEADVNRLSQAARELRDEAQEAMASIHPDDYDLLDSPDLATYAEDAGVAMEKARAAAEQAAKLEKAADNNARGATEARIDAEKAIQEAFDASKERQEAMIGKVLDNEIAVMLPLYLYDHGGITMNVGGYSCPWDSGQVGWIYVSKADARENWGLSRLSRKAREHAERILRAEVEEYAQYLRGEVYGFRWEVEEAEVCECCDNVEWNTVDEESCWGFLGWPSEYMIPDEINPSLAEYGVQVSN